MKGNSIAEVHTYPSISTFSMVGLDRNGKLRSGFGAHERQAGVRVFAHEQIPEPRGSSPPLLSCDICLYTGLALMSVKT